MSKSRWFKETFTPINQDWSNGASIDSLETTKLTINGFQKTFPDGQVTLSDLSTPQTFTGVKTFGANPLMTNTQSNDVNALVKKDYVDRAIASTLSSAVAQAKSNISETLLTSVYPVGSIMVRYDNIKPSSLPGLTNTTWQIIDTGGYVRTASAAGDGGKTGGSYRSGSSTSSSVSVRGSTYSSSTGSASVGYSTVRSYQDVGSQKYLTGLSSHSHSIPSLSVTTNSHSHTIPSINIEPTYVRMVFWRRTY